MRGILRLCVRVIYNRVYKISPLTRNAKSTRLQDHRRREGLVEANLFFDHRRMEGLVEANLFFGHDIDPKIIPYLVCTYVRTPQGRSLTPERKTKQSTDVVKAFKK